MTGLPVALTRRLVTAVAVAMSVFHLWVAFVGPPDAYVFRGSHLAFALVLAFLLQPGTRGNAERVGWLDVALVVAAVAGALYPGATLGYILNRTYYVDDPRLADYVFGGLLIVCSLEATRRATGWALPITAIVFIAFGLTWGHQSPGILLDQLYLTTEGVFGIPLYVSATYVMLFILFGAFVERSGAGQLFMKVPVVITLATALPETVPNRLLVITATLAGPPDELPARASAKSMKSWPAPLRSTKAPNRMNSITYVAET